MRRGLAAVTSAAPGSMATTEYTSAASATLRVIGPTVSSEGASGFTPAVGTAL
jgi:hypothetical protein